MLGANLVVEDAFVGPGLHESCSQGISVVFLQRIIGLFYYRKRQKKLYNYFTVYYASDADVCPDRSRCIFSPEVTLPGISRPALP
jgi:hypothetical protein